MSGQRRPPSEFHGEIRSMHRHRGNADGRVRPWRTRNGNERERARKQNVGARTSHSQCKQQHRNTLSKQAERCLLKSTSSLANCFVTAKCVRRLLWKLPSRFRPIITLSKPTCLFTTVPSHVRSSASRCRMVRTAGVKFRHIVCSGWPRRLLRFSLIGSKRGHCRLHQYGGILRCT